jgi:hypothetical protein
MFWSSDGMTKLGVMKLEKLIHILLLDSFAGCCKKQLFEHVSQFSSHKQSSSHNSVDKARRLSPLPPIVIKPFAFSSLNDDSNSAKLSSRLRSCSFTSLIALSPKAKVPLPLDSRQKQDRDRHIIRITDIYESM